MLPARPGLDQYSGIPMAWRRALGPVPTWLLLNVAALSAGLAHVFVDHHLGLYGRPSTSMSFLQATNITMTCLVVAWWIVCLVPTPPSGGAGLCGAFVLAVGWGFLANGIGALIAAPPPADAFPYQDLTHLLSLAFGALAAIATWRELKRSRIAWSWVTSGISILLMMGLFAAQGFLSVANL